MALEDLNISNGGVISIDRTDLIGKGNQHNVFRLVYEAKRMVLKCLGSLGKAWDHDDADLLEEDQQILDKLIAPHIDILETKIFRDVSLQFEGGMSDEEMEMFYGGEGVGAWVRLQLFKLIGCVGKVFHKKKENPGYVMLQPEVEDINPVTREDIYENEELRNRLGAALEQAIDLWEKERKGIDLCGGELVHAFKRSLFDVFDDLGVFNVWMVDGQPTLVDVKLIRGAESHVFGNVIASMLMTLQYSALAAVLKDAGYQGDVNPGFIGRNMVRFFNVWREMHLKIKKVL